nr:hypothetical protein [Tanacetum cinerariifolium]
MLQGIPTASYGDPPASAFPTHYMANEEENHALVANDEVPTEFALMAKSSSSLENKVYDDSYCSKSPEVQKKSESNTQNIAFISSSNTSSGRECKALRSQDRGKRERYKQGPKEEEPAPKALMAIDGIGWD